MTQTPEDIEQTGHLASVVFVGIALIGAGLFASTMIAPDDDVYAMVWFILRAFLVSVLGSLVMGGLYVAFDRIVPGSLSKAIMDGNVAAAIVAAAVILGGVLLLFAS